MAEQEKDYIKSTKEGRLYISTDDFFKQEKVRQMVSRLIKSDLYLNIKKQKSDLKSAS